MKTFSHAASTMAVCRDEGSGSLTKTQTQAPGRKRRFGEKRLGIGQGFQASFAANPEHIPFPAAAAASGNLLLGISGERICAHRCLSG